MASFKYVSCIKIAGAPILPPLITETDRKLCAFYKQKAIQKEKQLLRRKNLQSISKTSSDHIEYPSISDNISNHSNDSIETEKVMDFIRQALHDVGHTDVELLQSKILEEMQKFKMPFRSNSNDTLNMLEDISLNEDRVVESSARALSPNMNVQHENRDTSSGVDEQGEVLTPKALTSSLSFDYEYPSSVENNSSPANSPQQKISEGNIEMQNDQTPPKLIRRNSYTLDSPSPSVLLYLRSLGNSSSSEISNGKKVVKNLNNVWEGTEINTSAEINRISPGGNNNFLPETVSGNQDTPTGIGANNINIRKNRQLVDRAVCTDDENCELSPNQKSIEPTIKIAPEKLKAIIKIQAGIRGYLIRRLMKTNKVMELRNTIKDSLICALALHSEQNVSTADVNLYVRLIRQVTAACYELHAIFFEFTTREKMHIISIDREKLLSAKRAKMNLMRLKGIKSDDESPQNGIRNSLRGKSKRPMSLPVSRRGNALNRTRR
ncbi:hypothetical protein O3M35_002695 [Rhynocoris fuscipes]|uniref:Centriolar coiled-coil protein of 110 kDa n=1 Tax=Rhynocoris fuscipes TaxID=488301 RepID=A0AAW1CL64_9HEMI